MSVSFGLLHHANQFLITNGYKDREGISAIVGSEDLRTGMLGLLAVHKAAGMPLNLHISGTLLEAVSWHCPSAIPVLRDCVRDGLVEIIGSCYGQNIMRFFSVEYNVRQLNEELGLFESLLDVPPSEVKVFWPPERVWDTKSVAPVLRNPALINGGYDYVILDDRTLVSPGDPEMTRAAYDEESRWTPELYQSHEIENGFGLIALPIATRLRHSIPPRQQRDWQRVQVELEALLVQETATGDANFLALYADDMEKVSGVWNTDGPGHYADFIQWLAKNPWIRPVKLSDWTAVNPPAGRRKVEVGTFSELAVDFDAGEGYEKWFLAKDWTPYRRWFEQAQRSVDEAKTRNADQALIELAEKQLLVSNWETAWHTPTTGPHGNPDSDGKASPWARALTGHCRHALVTTQAARWSRDRDGKAHAVVVDADCDGEPDLILKNDRLFALVSPRWGGRLVSLFHLGDSRGAMVVGNPCDDWNLLEDLNRFMDTPRNHPGAFADVGFENDEYSCRIVVQARRVVACLTNIEKNSDARGLEKIYEFTSSEPLLTVRYRMPKGLKEISIECALSPDYLALLRHGSQIMTTVNGSRSRGFATPEVSVAVEPGKGVRWRRALQEWIGHGRTLCLTASAREFELKLRVREMKTIAA